MDSILPVLKDNYIAVIICSVIALILIPIMIIGRKHPNESPYVHRGIPVLGNFIEFAKGMSLRPV
jgi:hypothetical protein